MVRASRIRVAFTNDCSPSLKSRSEPRDHPHHRRPLNSSSRNTSVVAVTQQLARLPVELLKRCRSSVAEIEAVCEGRLLTKADYLDLDWSPVPIERVAVIAFGEGPAAAAVRQALSGGEVVNPAYSAMSVFSDVQVTSLEPDIVSDIAAQLRAIDPVRLLVSLPADREAAIALIGGSVRGLNVHPGPYVNGHLRALQSFYDGAAERGLAMVLWWD